jgi:hypothetical protein
MQTRKRRRGGGKPALFIAMAVLVVALLAAGAYLLHRGRQGRNDQAAATAAARKFADLWIRSADAQALKNMLSRKARASFEENLSTTLSFPEPAAGTTVSIGEAQITGDLAEVRFTRQEPGGRSEAGLLRLRREEGEWRITGIGGQLDPNDPATAMFLDFENPAAALGGLLDGLAGAMQAGLQEAFEKPFQDMFEGKAQPEDLAADDLRGMTAEEFERAWKQDLVVSDRPAGEVIAELARELGMQLERRAEVEAALGRPISMELAGRSRFELLETVCHSVGLHPGYSATAGSLGYGPNGQPPSISLREGARPLPAIFAGPFLVEIEELDEYAPHATGMLNLRVLASKLPLHLEQQLREKNPLRILEIVDHQNRNLRDEESDPGLWMPGPANESGLLVLTMQLALRNLVSDVATIAAIRGSLQFSLPAEVAMARFEAIEEGAAQAAGDVRITLSGIQKFEQSFNDKKKDQLSLMANFAGVPHERIKYVARAADGRLIHVGAGGGSIGETGQSYLTISGVPATLTAKVIARVEPAEYAFALTGVPLPSHQQMPATIEPVQFAGHDAPATLEYVRITGDPGFRKVLTRVVNHASKPIRRLEANLQFRGANGNTLKEDLAHHAINDLTTRGLKLVVGARSTAEIELLAFFMPEETKSVAMKLKRVVFADATDWRAE